MSLNFEFFELGFLCLLQLSPTTDDYLGKYYLRNCSFKIYYENISSWEFETHP